MNGNLTFAGLSDRGLVRDRNEDRWHADGASGLFVVADGMGGGPAGALAAEIVVRTLPGLLRQTLDCECSSPDEALAAVLAVLALLSDRVRVETEGQLGLAGLGATLVLALIREDHAVIAHMGDSRVYLLHGNELERLTHDHSMAQLLMDCGEITPDEALRHPSRHQLTRFVGMAGEPLTEGRTTPFASGDRLLLCTDGLTGMVKDEDLAVILSQHAKPADACDDLIAVARAAGGEDNITAVVVALS